MLVVGDVMLDRYWFGEVGRISPEAPVPVVKVDRVEDRPCGAANVARNAATLGARASLLSVTGRDEAGARLRRFEALVAEGGAIEVDGEGTIITTRQCLLNRNRNPGLSEKEVEGVLREALGAERVIWLDEGMIGDHTDGHVDNLARFIAPGKVVCMRPSGKDDPNAEIFTAIRKRLEASTDANGRALEVIELPSPGRAEDEGDIVPASHMNFYIANHSLVMPSYGGLTGEDETALECLEILERHVDRPHFYAIDSTHLLSGGGSFHCISQQQPAKRAN